MMNNNKYMLFVATTISTNLHLHLPQSQWIRFLSSHSSPPPPSTNKLFVGVTPLFLSFFPSSSSSSSSSYNAMLLNFHFDGVSGLSWSVDEKSLKDAFASFGDVTESRIVYDKDSGRSRGFGFVIFSNEESAKCAKDAMDGKALLGRPLRINFALEKARGSPVVVPRLSDVGHFNRR